MHTMEYNALGDRNVCHAAELRWCRQRQATERCNKSTYALQQRHLLAKAREQRHEDPVIHRDEPNDGQDVEQLQVH